MVSIIIPVYNVRECIKDCLESIRNQKFNNYEVVIVDDCSSDESGKICDEYALKDNRFHVYHHSERKGVSQARNTALDKAKGNYILFVDSDDCINSNLLDICVKEIEKNNVDMVIFPYTNFYSNNELSTIDNIPKYEVDFISREGFLLEFLGCVEHPRFRGLCCNKLYRAELFENIRFPVKYSYGEDSKVTYEVSKVMKTAIFLEGAVLYFYRIRPSSAMNTKFTEKNFDILYSYNEIYSDICKTFPHFSKCGAFAWSVRFFDLMAKMKNSKYKKVKNILRQSCPLSTRDIIFNAYITVKQKIILFIFKLLSVINI